MMPTRLQDGLSVALLCWAQSSEAEASQDIVIRIHETESLKHILQNLINAGLSDVIQRSSTLVEGRIQAQNLGSLARCSGISAITAKDEQALLASQAAKKAWP